MKKVQDFGRKSPKMAHSCPTVPVQASVVPVLKVYCWVLLGWYRYQQVWYRYHLATATFSRWVPVPISVVPVPLFFLFLFSFFFSFFLFFSFFIFLIFFYFFFLAAIPIYRTF